MTLGGYDWLLFAQAYLKQLGLEEYKWDQFTSGDPGLYWQDVPLENNPEAYLGQ